MSTFAIGAKVRLTPEHIEALHRAGLCDQRVDGQVGIVRHIISVGGKIVQIDFEHCKGRLLHIENLTAV